MGQVEGSYIPVCSSDMLLTVWLLRVSCEGFLGDQHIVQHSWKYFFLGLVVPALLYRLLRITGVC